MTRCASINTGHSKNEGKQCKNNAKYGDYCGIHMKDKTTFVCKNSECANPLLPGKLYCCIHDPERKSNRNNLRKCIAIKTGRTKNRGKQCTNKAKYGNYCGVHAKDKVLVLCAFTYESAKCTNILLPGKIYCYIHDPEEKSNEIDSDRCIAINTGSTNRGNQCSKMAVKGRKLCRGHQNKGRITCVGTKLDGKKCASLPSIGSKYCYHHDPKNKSEEVKHLCGAETKLGICGKTVRHEGAKCRDHNKENKEEKDGYKHCPECRNTKEIDKFSYNINGSYNRSGICRSCTNKIRKKKIKYSRQKFGKIQCSSCGNKKDVVEFGLDSRKANGLYISCIICRATAECARVSKTLEKFIHHQFTSIIARSKKHKPPRDVTITEQFIIDKYNEQKGICIKTGMKMTHEKVYDPEQRVHVNPKHYYNVSVDRYDSCIGYIYDNSQVVTFAFNKMKMDMDENELIMWCRKVADYDKAGRPLSKHRAKMTKMSEDFIEEKFNNLSRDTRRRKGQGIKVICTLEDLLNKYEETRGICYYTGERLTITQSVRKKDGDNGKIIKGNYTNYSVDRTSSIGEYVLDNIQHVCSIINQMKGEMTEEMFIKFCKAIANHNPLIQ